jgi:cardiolipin synthase A/B
MEVRIYHPFPWGIWQWSHSVIRLPYVLKMVYLLLKMNARNHRKTCLIDDQIAYVGSFNLAQCHISKEEGGQNWRDTAIRLTGVDLSPLKLAFEIAWENRVVKEGVKEIFHHISQDPIFRLNHSWYRRRILYKNLLKRINQCKERIWITNAYFIPDSFLLKKLKEAAKRKVDVRILLPRTSDVLMMPWASTTFYQNLLKAGVRIFEYLPSILHTKTLILDQWMTVGSSNLNHRSLLHDLEIDVNVQLPDSKAKIEQQFLKD